MDLADRLDEFTRTWISNPAAQLDFARLIRDVHEQPRADHANDRLLAWIAEQESTAKFLGIK
jgi:hypothetical protein